MQIAFLLYPTSGVRVNEDSSFWILSELKRRGHSVYHFQDKDLAAENGAVTARLTPAKLDKRRGYLPSLPQNSKQDLSRLDCVFIRKEPPFGNAYLHALQLLERIKQKTFVMNDPSGIAMGNEKLLILNFPRHIPDTLVTENSEDALAFIRKRKAPVVLKPLIDKAGHGVLLSSAKDPNLPSLLDVATAGGHTKIMIQRFIPEARQGDKRILLLDGEILGAYGRKPARGDFRSNLSAGATLLPCRISDAEKKLVREIAPLLRAYGLFFVGLDVAGSKLLEINVTSPAGIPELRLLYGTRAERQIADFIERKVPAPASDRIRFAG